MGKPAQVCTTISVCVKRDFSTKIGKPAQICIATSFCVIRDSCSAKIGKATRVYICVSLLHCIIGFFCACVGSYHYAFDHMLDFLF